jgi:hypothetical protein
MIELYEFIRDQGARPSFGTGAKPSVTIWLGEDPDPAAANPVAIAFSGNGLSVEFRFVRGRRTPAEMTLLLALMREIPGARPYLEGVEARDFRAIGGMKPDDVLSSDAGLEAFKNA